MDYDKLLTELYDSAHPQNQNWKAAAAIETLRADLARVTAERDAAVKCIAEIEDAFNFQRISAIGLRLSKWRATKKED